MYQSCFASILIVAGATIGVASPALALAQANMRPTGFHYGGGGMHMMPQHMPKPMGGCNCTGGGGHMSQGGGYHMMWGGKPTPGMHQMGMHFYGMGGGHLKYGSMYGGHSYGSMNYGMGSGGRSYGSWGAPAMHTPLGTHMMGMHYYGMGGGGLAAQYGHLEHGYEPMHVPPSWGYGHGSYGGGGYSRKKYDVSYSFHRSYEAKYKYSYSSGSKSWGTPSGGTWGSSSPSPSSYSGY